MKEEIQCAAHFLSSLLHRGLSTREQAERFSNKLQELLSQRFHDHWHPDKPQRGSGFRCIRINHKLDPLVEEALAYCGLGGPKGNSVLPKELALWIDPKDVSYRIGEDGSICQLQLIYEEFECLCL
ncbi:protein BTG2-like [Oscarella lobularis]|uniref:protein BTG2-like n=1 Tax=Oscarella lobularis TaxID=121494 RepID=UPI003313BE17